MKVELVGGPLDGHWTTLEEGVSGLEILGVGSYKCRSDAEDNVLPIADWIEGTQ